MGAGIGDTYISIHALRMEGDSSVTPVNLYKGISIHALRMEGDPVEHPRHHRRAISIHALRMEGDGWDRAFDG